MRSPRLTFHPMLAFGFLLLSCGGGRSDGYPMELPHWDAEAYKKVMLEIRMSTPVDEKYPSLSDPELAPVFQRLIDRDNVAVLASDTTLGIQFRYDALEGLFLAYRELIEMYSKMDREDVFIYDIELAEICRFGLHLQVEYFRLGREALLAGADTPGSVASTINGNQVVLLRNFNNYLDYVNYEKSFGSEALGIYTEGIGEGFGFLIDTYPNADYAPSIVKAEAMLAKAKDENLRKELGELIARLKTISSQ